MTRAGGIHEIILTVLFKHEGVPQKKSVAPVLGMSLVSVNPFMSGVSLPAPHPKTVVYAPQVPQYIDRAVVNHECLNVECDGTFHETVGHEHSPQLSHRGYSSRDRVECR